MKLLHIMRSSEPHTTITYTAPFRIVSDLTPTFLQEGVQGALFVLGSEDYEGKDSFGQALKIVESYTTTQHALEQPPELGTGSYEHDGVSNVFPKLYEYVEKTKPDVILAFTPLFAEIFALRELRRKFKITTINYCGCTPVERQMSNGSKVSGFEFLSQNKDVFDSHVAISHCTKTYLAESGIDAEVIYAGVNPDEFLRVQTPKEEIVMYSGRFHFDKGADLIPDIIQRVLKRKRNAKFLVTGYGPMHTKLDRELRAFINNVSLETLDNDRLKEAYRTAHTYFKPSRANEAFCVSAVEAMAAGNHMIYSGLEGIALREIVGDTGIPIAELDPELYAEEIVKSLKYNHAPNQAAVDRVREKFDIRRIAEEWIRYLNSL